MQISNNVTLKSGSNFNTLNNENGTSLPNRYTLICATNGFLTVNCTKRRLLLSGQCAIINKGVTYFVKNVNEGDSDFIIISLSDVVIDGFIKEYPNFATEINDSNLTVFTPDKRLFDLTAKSAIKGDSPSLIGLAVALIGEYVNNLYGFKNHTKTDCAPLLKKRIDFNDLLCQKIYDEYKKYPVSHTLLISEFKSLTALTPSDYLITKSVELAKILLENTSLSINEISEVTGYKSISHFIKRFKEKEGITPLAYKNSINK